MIQQILFAPERTGTLRDTEISSRRPKQSLPVRVSKNKILKAEWGNTDNKFLPRTLYCQEESLKNDQWSHLTPKEVLIPASFLCTNKVWYHIQEAVKGILVHCNGRNHCYILTIESTHYFKTMTRSDRMPVLHKQLI